MVNTGEMIKPSGEGREERNHESSPLRRRAECNFTTTYLIGGAFLYIAALSMYKYVRGKIGCARTR